MKKTRGGDMEQQATFNGTVATVTGNIIRPMVFETKDARLSLPLKTSGGVRHKGWDIPTLYAVDAEGQCWVNDAYGGHLYPCCKERLEKMFRDDENLWPLLEYLDIDPPTSYKARVDQANLFLECFKKDNRIKPEVYEALKRCLQGYATTEAPEDSGRA